MSKESPATNPHKVAKSQNVGPIFDKKHPNKKKLAALSGLAVGVVVILFIILPKINSSKKPEPTPNQSATISTVVLKGDSKTTAARRAISGYLASHSDISLSAGQRLFLETNLRNALSNVTLKVGEAVEFKTSTINELITAAKALKASTLAKWQALAKGIKF